ncbi:MAG: CDGSH iron-sulfur domain-containing protein [Gemmatimonadales bacterium]
MTITPYRDGPYVVRGAFKVVDEDGCEIELGRRTVALCRCGKSRIRPLCDGTHRAIGFQAPGRAEEYGPVAPDGTALLRGEGS